MRRALEPYGRILEVMPAFADGLAAIIPTGGQCSNPVALFGQATR